MRAGTVCMKQAPPSYALLVLLAVLSEARSGKTCSRSGDNYCRCSTGGEDGIELDLRNIGLSYPYVRVCS